MKFSYFFIAILFSTNLLFAQGKLVSYQTVGSYSTGELEEIWKKNKVPKFIAPIRFGIDIYELIYLTCWHDGQPVQASGLYFVPKISNSELPLIFYHHGTRIEKERGTNIRGENAICAGFAADGYLVAMPDYIGLGKGEKFHLYQHAESEATSSIDMLYAVRELNLILGIEQNEQLFITGYSQGGHAAMALHKKIQEDYSQVLKVTASAPMSGAYDMSGVQSGTMMEAYTAPGYLPYLLIGYNDIYHLFDEEIYSVFKEPYDSIIRDLYNGQHSMRVINKQLPDIPSDMLREELVELYLNDPDFPLKKALKENNVYDWKPESPMLICYCKSDEQVTYKNALVAYKTMQDNGSRFVKLKHAGKKFSHNKCALLTTFYTKLFFDSIRNGSEKGRKGSLVKRMVVSVSKMKLRKK